MQIRQIVNGQCFSHDGIIYCMIGDMFFNMSLASRVKLHHDLDVMLCGTIACNALGLNITFDHPISYEEVEKFVNGYEKKYSDNPVSRL